MGEIWGGNGRETAVAEWRWAQLERTWPTLAEEERPLHCVQQGGEIVYLPAGWAHLTVNLDEVIGAGAQSNLRAEDIDLVLAPAARRGDPEAQMYMVAQPPPPPARCRTAVVDE